MNKTRFSRARAGNKSISQTLTLDRRWDILVSTSILDRATDRGNWVPASSEILSNGPIPNEFFLFANRNRFGRPVPTVKSGSYLSAAYAACEVDESFAVKYRNGTANYLPYLSQESDLPTVPEHVLSVDTGFRVEYDAEATRREFFPFAPSRVSALFAFGDEETCKRAHDYFAWDIKHVVRAKLQRGENVRVWRVNMEIISILREVYAATRSVGRYSETWKSYWAGEGNITIRLPHGLTHSGRKSVNTGIMWQYLIEGRLTVLGQ